MLIRSVLALVLLCTSSTSAQSMPVPVSVQWAMFARVLSFEHNLSAAEREIVIGVLYQSKVRESKRTMEELVAAVQKFSQGRWKQLQVYRLRP